MEQSLEHSQGKNTKFEVLVKQLNDLENILSHTKNELTQLQSKSYSEPIFE